MKAKISKSNLFPETNPVFIGVGGSSLNMTPYLCHDNCLKQGTVQGTSKVLTIGISKAASGKFICLCGTDFDDKTGQGEAIDN